MRRGITLAIAASSFLACANNNNTSPPGDDDAPPSSAGCPAGLASDPAIGQLLPQKVIDTTLPAMTGTVIAVPAGGDLQQAIDSAAPGDVIELAAGASYTGPITLPQKPGSDWIVIRSSGAIDLPDGARVGPGDAAKLATIVAPQLEPAVIAAPGAHHYRLIGLELTAAAYSYNLLQLDPGSANAADFPHDLVVDRCYLHGNATAGTRRGIALNSASTAVINSYFTDFKEEGADAQAIAGWGGPGPYKIVNNFLAGAGENILFGGDVPSVSDTVPSDIEICGNHIAKSLAWKADDPSYEGTAWTVKNLLELKNAQRVVIGGNVLENNWAAAQVGFAVLFTVRGEGGQAAWATVQDITFSYNIVRHTASGFNMYGHDDLGPSQSTIRIVVSNNLVYDIDDATFGGNGRSFQIVGDGMPPLDHALFEHNTVIQTAGTAFMVNGDSGISASNLVFRNNIVSRGEYGWFGGGAGEGSSALAVYAPDAKVSANAIVGPSSGAMYPSGNFFPSTLTDVDFADPASGDYTLQSASMFAKQGTDGTDLGVDMAALQAATAGVVAP